MVLKIETATDGQRALLRLIGRIRSDDVGGLREHIQSLRARVVLDLDQVTLVDAAGVRFLVECEAQDIELVRCPPYIREWMGKERRREGC
jgi:anti-anti-sigma regulatory factor